MNIWIVSVKQGRWSASDRSCDRPNEYEASLRSAYTEAELIMNKHPIRNDLSKAVIVSDGRMFGVPMMKCPHYIDYSITRETPEQAWVIENVPTRYQAIKIAKEQYEARLKLCGTK